MSDTGTLPATPAVIAAQPVAMYDDQVFTSVVEEPAMHADTIREFLRREPFEPLAIRPSNCEGHEIRHPGCALLMKTKVIVGYPDEDRTGLSGTGAGSAKIGARSGFSRPGFPFAGMLGA